MTVTYNAVARKQKVRSLALNFLASLLVEMDIVAKTSQGDATEIPKDHERCAEVQDDTMLRCTCRRVHESKHEYTKKGTISLRKLESLLKTLTPIEWKQLTGLDDKAFETGRDNFERCRNVCEKYFDAGPEQKNIVERIDKHELFCQTDLRHHYCEESCHKCNCFRCGFFEKGK
jgi:hypothetical protein